MARQQRVPATRKLPRVELLEIKCEAVTIIRDNAGKIIGKGIGQPVEVHSVEEFEQYLDNCSTEIASTNKLQK